jgi:hypothetical protein
MGEFFKGLFDKAPDIIGKAAQSPLGLVALSVLVLGIVGVFLFRNAAGKVKLAAFAVITGGFLGFLALVVAFASNPNPALIPPPDKTNPEKTALGNKRHQNSPKRTA